ncbi:hypothetical protein ETAA1_14210 [Urbifossiella limnaea]|uniref:Uncharacterized protein n=1 Tax=Urbifossiella limnaea TaxID=2528023 RepID=A0A517XPS3_9BACT|nr:hypothetical protein ETAA1_14210 [Urbifossiella limnaea]
MMNDAGYIARLCGDFTGLVPPVVPKELRWRAKLRPMCAGGRPLIGYLPLFDPYQTDRWWRMISGRAPLELGKLPRSLSRNATAYGRS